MGPKRFQSTVVPGLEIISPGPPLLLEPEWRGDFYRLNRRSFALYPMPKLLRFPWGRSFAPSVDAVKKHVRSVLEKMLSPDEFSTLSVQFAQEESIKPGGIPENGINGYWHTDEVVTPKGVKYETFGGRTTVRFLLTLGAYKTEVLSRGPVIAPWRQGYGYPHLIDLLSQAMMPEDIMWIPQATLFFFPLDIIHRAPNRPLYTQPVKRLRIAGSFRTSHLTKWFQSTNDDYFDEISDRKTARFFLSSA